MIKVRIRWCWWDLATVICEPRQFYKGVTLLIADKGSLVPSLPIFAAAAAKSLQLCPTLCDPRDHSAPGSPVPGILQARTLEWVAISFSNAWKWKVKVKLLSRVRLLATHGLQPTRLLRPWDFPGKRTGVGCHCYFSCTGFPRVSEVKKSTCNAGDTGSVFGLGRSPGEGNCKPLQCSCWENSMNGGAWWATVLVIAKRTWLCNWTHTYFSCTLSKRFLGEGNGTPLQYSCLENPMDGGTW